MLRTESQRKKGLITKSKQIQIITENLLLSIRRSVAPGLSLSILLLFFPALNTPFSILYLIGIGKASRDIFNTFWNGLTYIERKNLLDASMEAGISLRRFIEGN